MSKNRPSAAPGARIDKPNTRLDRRLFTLTPERFDALVDTLENPPAPGPKLRSLLRRSRQGEK
jgi:uncharacterized protein (DUF1778 family)